MKLLSVFFVLCLLGAIGYLVTEELQQSNFNKGYTPAQPIAFSHKIHAGDNQINCKYCHFAAEQGRHAGIPPVGICMNCHSKIKKESSEIKKIEKAFTENRPINWIKVHHFPDYAYFNHSQHVKVGKVACQECHGPVETMARVRQHKELNMGWCLDCHRKNEIAPPNDHKSAKGGDCARCHY